jgi:SAM-dependent methyltransferase
MTMPFSSQPVAALAVHGITNQEHVVELVRRAQKSRLLLHALGGLVPGLDPQHFQGMSQVLDIACGPGIWTLELARAAPSTQVIGIETSQAMISYALHQTRGQGLPNAQYQVVSSLVGPLAFADSTFDLISLRLVSTRLKREDWPRLLAECWRLLRPGGKMHVTEGEVSMTNSPAHEELARLFLGALQRAGIGFSLSGRHLGLLCELEPLLSAAGFHVCSCRAHMVNYSYGADLYEAWKRDTLIFVKEVQPFLVQTGVATEAWLGALYQQLQYEMNLPAFHALQPFLTVWGTKG